MAQTYLSTELQVGNFEDRINVITRITPDDTPFVSKAGKAVAKNTTHSWQTQSLATASAINETVEGASVTYAAADFIARVNVFNYTQTPRKPFSVSYTQDAVNKPQIGMGPKSEYNEQKMLKTRELARDIESSLVSNNERIQPLPESSQAGRSRGAERWIATNAIVAANYSDTLLSPAMYDDAASKAWIEGGHPNLTFANIFQKRRIAGFVTPTTRSINEQGKKFVNVVDVYEGAAGISEIALNRYLTASVVFLLDMRFWFIAWLRPFFHETTGPLGGKTQGYVESEWTLEVRQEASSAKITGLQTQPL